MGRETQPGYRIETEDWPANARDDDPGTEETYRLFREFDHYFDIALKSLARVDVPRHVDHNGNGAAH